MVHCWFTLVHLWFTVGSLEEHTAADDQGATAGVATGAEYSVAYRSRGLAVGSA